MGSRSSGEDELPSLFRRSHISSEYEHDRRFEARNSEDVHKDALAAALAEHERIREIAVRAYQLHEEREQKEKLRVFALQEEEHLKVETERAKLECKLRDLENKAKQIPKPAPRVPTPPPPAPPVETPKPKNPPTPQVQHPEAPSQVQTPQHVAPPRAPTPPSKKAATVPPTQPLAQPVQPAQSAQILQKSTPSAKAAQPPKPTPSHLLPGYERYAEIHKTLKQLRQFVQDAGNKDLKFKKKVGEMRRTLRMTVGQLTPGAGTNLVQKNKVIGILEEALTAVPSAPADPTLVMISKPEPKEGAKNNGDSLPSLFVFLLNHFSKAIISQLATEVGTKLDAADPIGILVAQVFASPLLHWRGTSLIDIFMAKMWKECPVLFGARGNEKTEEGRARLGWRKEGGEWVQEIIHTNRMTGLGAGYAAISLRNFSLVKMENPFPPYHYWQTFASIVSTPPNQTSTTQYTVLKGMIEKFEGKFMEFYGDAARAALRVALVDFPGRALDQNNSGVSSLKVLADILERDTGLALR